MIGFGLAMFSEEDVRDFCWAGEADVHRVCVEPATALDADIEGCAFGSCAEWARKAAKKLLRNGL